MLSSQCQRSSQLILEDGVMIKMRFGLVSYLLQGLSEVLQNFQTNWKDSYLK